MLKQRRYYTWYEHKKTGFRIAYLGLTLSSVEKSMIRRRRRLLNAVELVDFQSFLTLTYRNECLPEQSAHIRETLHRMKVYFRKYNIPPFSYVWVVEYGELLGRPHWHVLTDIDYYNAVLHEKLPLWWNRGFVKVKEVSDSGHAAKYVLKYMAKNESRPGLIRRYGTSRNIPATPISEWMRMGICSEEELEVLIDLNNDKLMPLERVYLKEA